MGPLDQLYGVAARLRSLWRGLRRRGDVEAEMAEEFRHHLEMRTADLVRRGLAPAEAARRARLEFGHVDGHKEDARASRGLHAFDRVRFSWLDVKLGLRMLVRYPGLTLVGGLALAFAIFVGAGTFHFIGQMLDPKLPLPAGERIVGLRYWDRAENRAAFPRPFDLATWRAGLRSVVDVGGFVATERNLARGAPVAAGAETGAPVQGARMSAAGFRVAGVAPLLGRALVDADEAPAAPPVVVLGHSVWRERFGGDPSVVGRVVRLGETQATVVGVMPEGFTFPRDALLWEPLSLDATVGAPGTGASLRVFGRLAPGATLADAQAEADALLARAAREHPDSHRNLRAQALPYAASLSGLRLGTALRLMVHQVNVLAALFLVLVASNVALLMFARTAAREREIVVRTALGASRGRIVTQLFVEALVLAAFATLVGLAATGPALAWVLDTLSAAGGMLPFWIRPRISASTATYAAVLALASAAIAGVVPALKATGRATRARLGEIGAGAGTLRLGGIWTAIVVAQIAATVLFTGVAYVLARQAERSTALETHFPAEQYVGVRLELDPESRRRAADTASAAFQRHFAARVRELERRVAEHPSVVGVTLSERLPLKAHATSEVEVEGEAVARSDAAPRHEVSAGAVDPDFFDVMRAPVLAGRALDERDVRGGTGAVVVSRAFVDEVLGGRSAVGRRIRYVARERDAEPGPWLEIVGVVRDLGTDRTASLDLEDPARARVYHAFDSARAGSAGLHMVVHVRGAPGAFVPTLYRMAEGVSSALQVHDPLTLDRANRDLAQIWRLYADIVSTVGLIALVLSLAGIYAVMSFTVARRTREIGVRVALGARPARVIAEIFRRPFAQIGAGVAVGCVLVAAVVWALTGGRAAPRDGLLLLAWGVGTVAVCALACVAPTLRALRVQPAVALSAES